MNAARRVVLLLATMVLGSGCKNVAPDEEFAALIVNPDDASRAALRVAVNTALNTEVLLADDALTQSSLLVIERNPPRTMEQPHPQGRIMDVPIQFRLVSNGVDCFLVDQRDGSRQRLDNTECVAE